MISRRDASELRGLLSRCPPVELSFVPREGHLNRLLNCDARRTARRWMGWRVYRALRIDATVDAEEV